ncbi:hypothetical protein [Streptomyces sp. NPDC001530]|uniref:hypothetical protein n=1 Tax=Streptomyces sp. NPDC001530 TaxID=3364582 RepID=UPI0036AB44B7
MSVLPEPKPTAPAAGQATPTSADRETVRRLMAAIDEIETPTSYDNPDLPSHKDGARIGDTPPVPQPDTRIAPQWAVGIAVASIGVGAGATGLGCAAWLAFKGLSMVSVPGLERFAWIIIAPFAGTAMVLTALGCLIGKAKRAAMPDVHNHNGPEYHEHHTTNTRAVWAKTINKP